MTPAPVVCLVDVDNTLFDNDRFRDDLRAHLAAELGDAVRDRYLALESELFRDFGYRDYLGAVQQLWEERRDPAILRLGDFLLDYPFAELLYPGALEVLGRLREASTAVVLTDGDAVFQPRKVERAGVLEAVDGALLVYVHKEDELADVELRYPAERYVLIDDKPRILAAAKAHWGARVTTVLPLQGQFALVPGARESADVAVGAIADLLALDPVSL